MKFTIIAVFIIGIVTGVGLNSSYQGYDSKKMYENGYRDALYKRPVSHDLEMVCLGLWVAEQTAELEKRNQNK